MTSMMMMERTAMGMPGMGTPTMAPTGVSTPAAMPTTPNWMMVPRCTFKFEKCQGGMKIYCVCEDKVAASMLQNLCTMLAGGAYSCCCTYNGLVAYYCNFLMGTCKWDATKDGVCVTCTSGDAKCCEMIQSCCDCVACMTKDGCTCCFMMNNTPVCCGTC
jgi:hypothetical protein